MYTDNNIPYEEILPLKDADYVLRQHGRKLGGVLHVVTPINDFTAIRVIPIICAGVVPYGKKDVVWATVQWESKLGMWVCAIENIIYGRDFFNVTRTTHKTVQSALRRARKIVGANAPSSEGVVFDPTVIPFLTSPYPSEKDYMFAKSYWADVEQDLLYEDLHADEDPFYDDPYEDDYGYMY